MSHQKKKTHEHDSDHDGKAHDNDDLPDITQVPQKTTYLCQICEKTFGSKSSITKHMKKHRVKRGKYYSCHLCASQYVKFGTFLTHMTSHRTHKWEDRHKCFICNKTFTQAINHMDHMRVHTGEKYECTICNKTFVWRRQLPQTYENTYRKETICLYKM